MGGLIALLGALAGFPVADVPMATFVVAPWTGARVGGHGVSRSWWNQEFDAGAVLGADARMWMRQETTLGWSLFWSGSLAGSVLERRDDLRLPDGTEAAEGARAVTLRSGFEAGPWFVWGPGVARLAGGLEGGFRGIENASGPAWTRRELGLRISGVLDWGGSPSARAGVRGAVRCVFLGGRENWGGLDTSVITDAWDADETRLGAGLTGWYGPVWAELRGETGTGKLRPRHVEGAGSRTSGAEAELRLGWSWRWEGRPGRIVR